MDNKYKAVELSDEQMAQVVGGKYELDAIDGACGQNKYINSEGKCSGYSEFESICRDCKYSEFNPFPNIEINHDLGNGNGK